MCLDKTVRRMLVYTLVLVGVSPAIAQEQVATGQVGQPAAQSIVPPVAEQASQAIMKHGPALNAYVCAPDGVALGGYDLVSYFTQDQPQLGDVLFETELLGLRYRFLTAKNRAMFLDDPQRYLPSYRGWCSTNLSMGRLACPDYTNYKIEDGQLLFFERVGFTNGLDVWNSDPLLHKRQADQNFVLLSK